MIWMDFSATENKMKIIEKQKICLIPIFLSVNVLKLVGKLLWVTLFSQLRFFMHVSGMLSIDYYIQNIDLLSKYLILSSQLQFKKFYLGRQYYFCCIRLRVYCQEHNTRRLTLF